MMKGKLNVGNIFVGMSYFTVENYRIVRDQYFIVIITTPSMLVSDN